jgi:regulatory protein
MGLLARREHSEQELQQKLQARGYGPEAVGEVLAGLKTAGMQDDVRYTEAYIRSRVAKGYGPVRISRELFERGITDKLVTQVLTAMDMDWDERIRAVRQKKFGLDAPADIREQARQSRFLLYRGFTSEQTQRVFKRVTD